MDQQQQQTQLFGSKKRHHMPHELFGRFSSKSDFIRYFRDNCKCTTNALSFECSAIVPAS